MLNTWQILIELQNMEYNFKADNLEYISKIILNFSPQDN